MTKTNKLLISFLFLFLIGSISWFFFFPYGGKWLEDRISLATEDLRQKGYEISYSALKISGNPFSVQAIIQNPHLKDPHGLVEWQGQEIKITMQPWEPYTLKVSLPGEQKVSVPQNSSLSLGVLHLEGAKGLVHLTSKGHLETTTVTIDRLSSFLEDQPQPLSLKDLSLHVSNITDPLNLKLSLSAQLMNIDKLLNKDPIDHPFTVNFVADLSGFKSELPFPKSLAAWRDGGGVLEVRLLKIDWPPILAELEGTLTIDEEMYPLGAFSSRISGYKEVINDMVKLEWLKKKKAVVALFMLDLLSSSDEKGEKQLKAPITLQNKRLSVGPAPLLKLMPIGGK